MNIVFIFIKISKLGDGYMVVGNMKMKGVMKVFFIFVKFIKSGNGGEFIGIFNVNCIDFGIGEKLKIMFDVLKILFNFFVKVK